MTPRQLPDEPFTASALCTDMDEETFTEPAQLPTAVAACGHCPVVEDCLTWALDTTPTPAGVWGGHTDRQRRHMTVEDVDDALAPRRDIPPLAAPPSRPAVVDPSPRPPATPRTRKQPPVTSTLTPPPPPITTAGRPEPYVTALPARVLFVDGTYQRDLDERRVARMVAEFDPTLLGVLEVSDRGDDTYAILEGQHRWAAATEARGVDHHLVCQVHRGLTVTDEARVFYEIDRRRKTLSGWDRWKARRGSGEALVLEIEGVVAAQGLRIDMAPKAGNVRATVALEKVMTLGGRPLLISTLAVLHAAYGDTVDGYDGTLIQGLCLVLHHYRAGDEIDTDRLVRALQGIPPRQVKVRAAAMREVFPGELPKLCGAVVIRAYNEQPGRRVQGFLERIKPHGKLGTSRAAS